MYILLDSAISHQEFILKEKKKKKKDLCKDLAIGISNLYLFTIVKNGNKQMSGIRGAE